MNAILARSAALLLACALAAACAPMGAPSTGPAQHASWIARQEVAAANAELVRLLAERRSRAVWAWFAAEGALITPGLRLVDTETKMREYVGGSGFELRGARLGEVEVEVCRDRALVQGILSTAPDGGAAAGNWRYSAVWQRGVDGEWRAVMAVLDGPRKKRTSLGRRCAPSADLNRRWVVTGYVYPLVYGQGGAPRAVRAALVEQGFSGSGRGNEYPPRAEADKGDFMVDVRARLRPPLGLEGLYSRTPRRKVPGVQRLGPHQYHHVAATLNTDFAAAAVFYELLHLRVGAGPALSRTRWSWDSDDGVPGQEWSTTDPGLLLLAAMSLPFGSHVVAEVQGQLRLLPDADLPAFNRFSATSVRQSSVVFSVGFGIGL
jgi:hypothetical protein